MSEAYLPLVCVAVGYAEHEIDVQKEERLRNKIL